MLDDSEKKLIEIVQRKAKEKSETSLVGTSTVFFNWLGGIIFILLMFHWELNFETFYNSKGGYQQIKSQNQ